MNFSNTKQANFTFSLALFVALFLLSPIALHADALDSAKQDLLIGEQWDGYLGAVDSNLNASLRSLISSVNNKRRAKYSSIAKNNHITLSDVEILAAKKTFQRTQSGHMLKLQSGGWRKK